MVRGGVPNTTVPLESRHERIPPIQAHQEFLNDWINVWHFGYRLPSASYSYMGWVLPSMIKIVII